MSIPHIHVQQYGYHWTVTCYGQDGRAKHFANCATQLEAFREAALLARIYRVPKRALVRSSRGEMIREW